MSIVTDVETIRVQYDLFELPTPQHKAGLAGFVLLVESLKQRGVGPLPKISLGATTAEITFTQQSLQVVFDDVYDAQEVEIESRSKWRGKVPLEVVEREVKDRFGVETKQDCFVYAAIQPRGAFLETFLPDGDGLWLKLWRDVLWQILRGIPAARKVYQERADGKPSSVAAETWMEFGKARQDARRDRVRTSGISSSLYLGAQDVNAERVSFRGRTEHNFLLHFWTIVALLFDVRGVKVDGDVEDGGFVIAVPEPANLEMFTQDIVRLLSELGTAKAGYRPRETLIHVPAEGGLEYLSRLARYRTGQALGDCIVAVEVLQMRKQGHSVRALAADRIEPRQQLLEQYAETVAGCWNPLYRSLQIENLRSGKPWFMNVAELFATYPWFFFIYSVDKTPERFSFFGSDVSRKFRDLERDHQQQREEGSGVTVENLDDELSRRIYRVIRQYVTQRSEGGKGGRAYRDVRESVARDAFLAMGSRRAEDFVEYFIGTICAVPHFLSEEAYLAVTHALLNDTDRVKMLSMLALSATSYVSGTKQVEGAA